MSAIISYTRFPLGVHQRQSAPPLRILLVLQEQLGPARDDRQRIVDLVARPGRELGHRLELLHFERLMELGLQLAESGEPRGEFGQSGADARDGL